MGTGAHTMKTTVELPDELATRAKAHAAKHGTTLRAVIEQGIRQVLSESRERGGFELRDASVGGQGLRAEFRGAHWAEIRDAAYKGRGG